MIANGFIILFLILLWSAWSIFEKQLGVTVGSLWGAAYYSGISSIMFPVFYFLAKRFNHHHVFSIKGLFWTICATVSADLASLLSLYLFQRYPTGWLTSITSAYPIITMILGFIFMGERLSIVSIFGALFVTVGIGLLSTTEKLF